VTGALATFLGQRSQGVCTNGVARETSRTGVIRRRIHTSIYKGKRRLGRCTKEAFLFKTKIGKRASHSNRGQTSLRSREDRGLVGKRMGTVEETTAMTGKMFFGGGPSATNGSWRAIGVKSLGGERQS